MEPRMFIGDRVVVKPSSCEYHGGYVGMVGTITMIYSHAEDDIPRYRVRLDRSTNRITPHGDYWFSQNSIEKISVKNEFVKYCQEDVRLLNELSDSMHEYKPCYLPKIKKVIFNPPATIIFWQDDTKTVVKAVNESYDPEKGLAMAISKKAFGNNQSYYSIFERNIKNFNSNMLHADDATLSMTESLRRLGETLKNFNK